MISIDTVWARIKAHEGDEFHQIRGKSFIYTVQGAAVVPEGINQMIPKSHFERALEFLPLENTVPLQEQFRGPSYIYAILMDPRVRKDDEWGAR